VLVRGSLVLATVVRLFTVYVPVPPVPVPKETTPVFVGIPVPIICVPI
jgi:hypothetical protein